MRRTAAEIADLVGGRVVGDPGAAVTGMRGLESASAGDLAFVRDEAAVPRARASRAGVLLVPRALDTTARAQVVVADPVLALGKMLEAESAVRPRPPAGVHPTAAVAPGARLGISVSVGPHCVVGDGAALGDRTVLHAHVVVEAGSSLGADCEVQSHVTIREGVRIGSRVRVDCGTSIGTDGFTVVVRPDGLRQLPQVGTVEIGDDVDIGAHVTVDRATLDATRIGNGVKIDNHSHIAHNVVIGDHTLLVAYAKIAGTTEIGKHVVVAEDVGITDNVTIGDRCRIGGGSRVFRSLPPGSEVWGSPARPLAEEKRVQAILARLPEVWEEIRALRKEMRGLGA